METNNLQAAFSLENRLLETGVLIALCTIVVIVHTRHDVRKYHVLPTKTVVSSPSMQPSTTITPLAVCPSR